MKRWEQALKMFELSIRFNAKLFQLLANKLVYLKFKILSQVNGYDEEVSLKSAITYRYLSECTHNMANTFKDDHNLKIEQLLGLDNTDPIRRPNKMANTCEANSPQTLDSFVSKLFSGGDQRMIRNNPVLKSTFSSPKSAVVSVEEDNQSVDLEFKELVKEEPKQEEESDRLKNDSIQDWIDTNFQGKESVSKLCSFDDEVAKDDNPDAGHMAWDNCSVTSDSRRSSIHVDFKTRQPATNLLKLRGVYIGNLKLHCDHKKLKDLFKHYGTIVEMYQPSGADYAFIHYKIHESATNMLNEWKGRHLDQCKDGKPLVVRFTASQEQMKKFNSLSYSEYKKKCNDSHECERWRSGQMCPHDRNCPFKHVYINRAVDTLPDKRKVNWRCV